jgi:3,4-dihydroxy-2-butanone 4-phosphate synthase
MVKTTPTQWKLLFTVSVDLEVMATTGISADRAQNRFILANSDTNHMIYRPAIYSH